MDVSTDTVWEFHWKELISKDITNEEKQRPRSAQVSELSLGMFFRKQVLDGSFNLLSNLSKSTV